MRDPDHALDNPGRYFDLGSLEVPPFASPGNKASATYNDHPSILSGDSCAMGDGICPDDDNEGVLCGCCVALADNGGMGAADLLTLLVNWHP